MPATTLCSINGSIVVDFKLRWVARGGDELELKKMNLSLRYLAAR